MLRDAADQAARILADARREADRIAAQARQDAERTVLLAQAAGTAGCAGGRRSATAGPQRRLVELLGAQRGLR